MGILLTTPDTMAVLVLRGNDVITRLRSVSACGARNRCHPIGLKFGMGKLWTTPDTMAVLVLRGNDVFTTIAVAALCLTLCLKVSHMRHILLK